MCYNIFNIPPVGNSSDSIYTTLTNPKILILFIDKHDFFSPEATISSI